MILQFTDIGKHSGYTDTNEKIDRLLEEIEHMKWHNLPITDKSAPFSQGFALGKIIGSTPGEGIAASWDRGIDGRALLGVKMAQGNLLATSFWMDDPATGVTCVAFRKEIV